MKAELNYNNGRIAIDIEATSSLEEQVFSHLVAKVDGRGSLLEVIIKDGKIKIKEKN